VQRLHVPGAVHCFLLLLLALIGAMTLWITLTRVDLVARAAGRVRSRTDFSPDALKSHSLKISSDVGGRVVDLFVREGDKIKQGQTLMQIDTEELEHDMARQQQAILAVKQSLIQLAQLDELLIREFEVARDKATAESDAAVAAFERKNEEKSVRVRLAQETLNEARDHAVRTRLLFKQRAVPQTQLVKVETQLQKCEIELHHAELPLSRQLLDVFKQAVGLVECQFAVRKKQLNLDREVKLEDRNRLQSELDRLRIQQARATIIAPFAGSITQCKHRVGDIITAGEIGMSIGPNDGLEMEVIVPNDQVALLKVGMPARIKLDAFDHQKYGTLPGIVRFISSDSNINSANGRQVAAHYTVRVRLQTEELSRNEHRGRVRLGMTGKVDIVTEEESLIQLLALQIRQTISL